MPNWVQNNVLITFTGDLKPGYAKWFSEAIAKLDKKGKPVVGTVDFNRIIPIPSIIFQGDLGNEDKDFFGDKGCWYNWCRQNWGTKWNASESRGSLRGTDEEPVLDITFRTAWLMPDPIFRYLAEHCKVRIDVEFADEDMGNNCGKHVFEGGKRELVADYRYHSNKASRLFALRVWGEDE
jgi:hypothetical protein